MKKEIFAIYKQSRVIGTETWNEPRLLWCTETEEEAKKDTSKGIRNDGYLEYKCSYEKVDLYTKLY